MKNQVKDPRCLCGIRKSEHTPEKAGNCEEFRRAAHQPDQQRRVSHHRHGESRTYPNLMFRL